MNTPKRTARLAGVLYLFVGVFGLFAQDYARGTIYVPGDAAASAHNIVAHSTLVRLGVVADLAMATSFIFLGMAFYQLFKHVHKEVAGALLVFVAIGTGMTLVGLLYDFAALLLATDPSYASALGAGGSDALTLLFTDMHRYGTATAGMLFGLWLLPLGYLAYRSGMFPRVLGVVLMVACFGYLIDTFTVFLVPGLGATFSTIVTAPAGVAELWMVGYLLIVGVRTPKTASRAPITA